GLADEELDVVDEEQVEGTVVALEGIEALVLVGAHEVVNELLGMDVADLRFRIALEDLDADRLEEVRLAQPRAAVDEEGVVGGPGILSDLDRRGPGRLVLRDV